MGRIPQVFLQKSHYLFVVRDPEYLWAVDSLTLGRQEPCYNGEFNLQAGLSDNLYEQLHIALFPD